MKFTLTSHVTVSAYTVVEAGSREEALAIAEDREVVLGGIGTGTDEKEQWIISDGDGSPRNITIETEEP